MIVPKLHMFSILLKTGAFAVTLAAYGQSYSIQTLFGGPLVTEGASALTSVLRYPVAVAADANGNVYIADREDNRIWKVDGSGSITTFAGNGIAGYAGDNGPAQQASLNHPTGVAVDGAGNVYICDAGNNIVRRVGADGSIKTAAGNGTAAHSGDNGSALKASIVPLAIAVDSSGNLFISEGARVRKVSAATGTIAEFAGTGVAGFTGNLIQATKAEIDNVTSMAVDGSGVLYLADTGAYVIRSVNTQGIIRYLAGVDEEGESGDGAAPTSAEINPSGIAVNSSGTVIYISDASVGVIRKIDLSASTINLVAGQYYEYGFQGDGGHAGSSLLWSPYGLAVDSSNNLLICDSINQRIRRISGADNTISTIAGTNPGSVLNHPEGLSLDPHGNLYIADTGDNVVKELALSSGGITSLEQEPLRPEGLAADGSGNLYLTSQDYFLYDYSNQNWIVEVGDGTDADSGDGGPAFWAQIGRVTSVVMDQSRNIYFADYENHVVRKIDIKGKITLFAGNGSSTLSGDGGAATSAGMDPFDIVADASGNVYVADRANNRVRIVYPDGIIATVAGTGAAGWSGDNGPANQAMLNSPTGVAVDTAGDLYIADNGNGLIREVTPDGSIQTIAGNGTTYPFNGDGPALQCNFSPYRITIDGNNGIYVADRANDRIRVLVPVPAQTGSIAERGPRGRTAPQRKPDLGLGRLQ